MATTIQVDESTKKKLQSFGTKGDSYDDIINRLYSMAIKEQLRQLLFEGEAIPIEEAIAEAKKKWPK
ncbi:hypothetical protein COU60_04780 [Candidatus Pacearchaeota archaeon CG10_big_fil_rev_8_21_14_0_10_34_76]|nr:MAG: hypothetical protein COU60_04780 [Candidatus Pacearchaeota archaeon CG10_big_fil_rev_8_21_14_0_10_34_76]